MSNFIQRKKKKLAASIVAVLAFTTIAAIHTSATAPTFGKWASRTKTMYAVTSASYNAWSSGAAKWKNNTNFKVTASMGVSGGNYSYYSVNVNKSNVDWDGLCTTTMENGFIVKAILNLNTYFTSQSKYTSSILAGVAGHEIGHSLGLEHTSVVETSSIMHPYTFNSDGTRARALNPSSSDITVVNSLYPLTNAKSFAASSHADGKENDRVVHLTPSWAVYYEDEAALMQAADLVVTGKVVRQSAHKLLKGKYEDYSTNVNVEIVDVIKGEVGGDSLDKHTEMNAEAEKNTAKHITLKQMGAFDGDVLVVSEHTTLLQQEQEVKLYLRNNGDGTYRSINENDGVFLLKDGKYQNIASVGK